MKKTEYEIQLKQILNLAHSIHPLKIAAVLGAILHAETLGPILDPTLYLKTATSLGCQRRIVEAALQFQHTLREIASDPRYSQHTGEKQ